MEKKLVRGLSVVAFGFVVLIFSACPSDAVTCDEATKSLDPCQNFLVGDGADPSLFCCRCLQSILDHVGTPETRRDLCECYKKAAAEGGVKIDKAKKIFESCKISNPVPIDPNVDCSK
ncbi:Non-specific lipid-transfer protein [Morella rubra]|uniref:Non-specific lipid-transfer protein n=1 Tax=Morella rubra TaxID=262757 RepID=A0A6A1UUG5_9ROSI|nr:Non-specific lipid-transfer protein [Morella rubra]